MKYMLYSQGARGYGRISRSIRFCNVLSTLDKNYIGLVVSGNPDTPDFIYPPNTEVLRLPEITKLLDNNYTAKNLTITLAKILKLRGEIILGCIKGFEPDFLIIDNIPNGILGELADVIKQTSIHFPKTKIILLTRDILDSSESILADWKNWDVLPFLLKYFTKILVMGEKSIFDYEEEYQFTQPIKNMTHYCGYFSKDFFSAYEKKEIDPIDILVTTGGGVDGAALISNFINIAPRLDKHLNIKIITGSQMPLPIFQELLNKTKDRRNIELLDFHPNIPQLMDKCKLVIGMGGYNTVNEIIALNKKAIILPRTYPTSEQLIRATRLKKIGLVEMIPPDEFTDEHFENLIKESLGQIASPVSINFNTAERINNALFKSNSITC